MFYSLFCTSVKCVVVLKQGLLDLKAALQADVTAEAAKIKTKLNDSLYYPVVKLGISYRF